MSIQRSASSLLRWLELREQRLPGAGSVFARTALEGEGRRLDLSREDAFFGVFLHVLGVDRVRHVVDFVDELVALRVPETQLAQFLLTRGYLQRFFLAAAHADFGAQVERDLHQQVLQALQLFVGKVFDALVQDVQDQLRRLRVGAVQLAEVTRLLQRFPGVARLS